MFVGVCATISMSHTYMRVYQQICVSKHFEKLATCRGGSKDLAKLLYYIIFAFLFFFLTFSSCKLTLLLPKSTPTRISTTSFRTTFLVSTSLYINRKRLCVACMWWRKEKRETKICLFSSKTYHYTFLVPFPCFYSCLAVGWCGECTMKTASHG